MSSVVVALTAAAVVVVAASVVRTNISTTNIAVISYIHTLHRTTYKLYIYTEYILMHALN